LLTPGLEGIDRGALPFELQFVHANGEVAQAGQYGRSLPVRRAASVLTQRDIAAVMRAVFDRRPVVADDLQHRRVVVLVEGQTARVEADLRGRRGVRRGRVLRGALDRDDLPAPAQADVLRRDGDPGDAPVVNPSVALFPLALRGENPAGRAGVGLSPGCRSDCL